MWPLHTHTKDEYIRLIQTHLERQEKEPLNDMLTQAYEDYLEEEDFTAWCASVAHGMACSNSADLVARFLERFPFSYHPVQVDWSEILLHEGQVDEGSNEARAYLNKIHQAQLLDQVDELDLVREGISRAFLMLTAVYTEAGARSYSTNVIEYALLQPIETMWIRRYQTEHLRLSSEVRQPDLAKLDRKWRNFFKTGDGAAELAARCTKLKMPILAKRVEALAERIKTDANYAVDDSEIFQLLYETDKGAYVLL